MRPSHTRGSWEIDPIGATVRSWTPAGGRDVLFASRAGVAPLGHGGIPICAPWFGKGRDDVSVPRSHGLVKWVAWELAEESVTEDSARFVYTLDSSALVDQPGFEDYPDDLHYRYVVTITSPSRDVIIDHAFHTYFSVTDLANISIRGLEGSTARDYVAGEVESVQAGPLEPRGYHDTIYFGIGERIDLVDEDRTIHIRPINLRDSIVWNPGPDNAARTTGMLPEDWTSFVCIELGNVQRHAITLEAGQSLDVGMEISVTNH